MEFYLNILKHNGYKLTANRKFIHEVMLKNKRPLTLSEIQELCNKIDFATIYRIVNLYCKLQIVNQVNLFDKQQYYEIMKDDHHHHVVCQSCGKIDRVDLCVSDQVSKLTNYSITNHTMEFKGLCPECK